jgi:hypothetical protein
LLAVPASYWIPSLKTTVSLTVAPEATVWPPPSIVVKAALPKTI